MVDRCIRIEGGNPLQGVVGISGAKNSALPCLFATLLTDQPSKLSNLPTVTDIGTTIDTLSALGHQASQAGTDATIVPDISHRRSEVPLHLARAMRASILSLGPLLARRGEATVPLPGGCDFGTRPIDIHLLGLEAMGASIEMHGGVLHAKAQGLRATKLVLEFPTFTGTENLMMAATLAKGTTVIENAAREPEIVDLAEMLVKMGASISGAGSSTIIIEGKEKLHGASHQILPDRIEAGTYLAAAIVTAGKITLENCNSEHMFLPLEKFAETGAHITISQDQIQLEMQGRPKVFNLTTSPYPGFPTDLQAQSLAVNCVAEGTATVVEQVWQQRFRTADELSLMGAQISVHGNCATVTGVAQLAGAHVQASDLRASAALVIAGLAATGTTVIHGINHLERGYDNLPKKLQAVGASIKLD